MHMFNIYHGAGTLIYYVSEKNDIYIFLGKRLYNPGKGLWSIPGGSWEEKDGFVDNAHDYKETARRELFEETRFILHKESKRLLEKIWDIHAIFFNFEVFTLRAKRMKYPANVDICEFSKVKWFNLNKLPNPNECNEFLLQQINNLKIFLKKKGHLSKI